MAAGFSLSVAEGGEGGGVVQVCNLGFASQTFLLEFLALGEFLVTQRAMTIEVKRYAAKRLEGPAKASVCVLQEAKRESGRDRVQRVVFRRS